MFKTPPTTRGQIPASISLCSLHSFLHILSFYYFKSVNADKPTSFTQRNQSNGSICVGQGSTMSPASSLAGEQQEQGESCRGTFPGGMCQAGSPVCLCAASAFPLQPRLLGGLSNVTWVCDTQSKSQERLARKIIHVQTEEEGICFQLLKKRLRRGRTESKW